MPKRLLYKDNMAEKKNGFLSKVAGLKGKVGLGMLTAFKRSTESKQCIADAKSGGASGREARRVCRDQYGSRLGNAGRKLGILPQEAKGINVSQYAQKRFLNNSPSNLGMSNEQFAFGGDTGTVRTAGFNYLYLIPLVLFIPAIRKLIGFK